MNLRRRPTAIAEQLQEDDVDAVLAERATACERTSLAFADIRFSGIMLTALATRAEAEDRGEDLPPLKRDPDALARVVERIELRERLGFPDRDCYQRRPKKDCACLYDALDKADETATKAGVLEAAKAEHERHSKTYTTLPEFEYEAEAEGAEALRPVCLFEETQAGPGRPRQRDEHEARPRHQATSEVVRPATQRRRNHGSPILTTRGERWQHDHQQKAAGMTRRR